MDDVLNWMAIHPKEVDCAVVVVVAGIIIYLLRYARWHRRVVHRRIWAMHAKRKDLERYHLMKFEDVITDACFDMVARGEMTEKQERDWYAFFSEQYGMKGLIPGMGRGRPEAVKKGIKARMSMWWGKIHPKLPPMEPVKVDPTYNPKARNMKSKFVED